MDQATVIVGVQKIADVQRDHYNRSGTLISAAGAHAFCPNLVYASMLINGLRLRLRLVISREQRAQIMSWLSLLEYP